MVQKRRKLRIEARKRHGSREDFIPEKSYPEPQICYFSHADIVLHAPPSRLVHG